MRNQSLILQLKRHITLYKKSKLLPKDHKVQSTLLQKDKVNKWINRYKFINIYYKYNK